MFCGNLPFDLDEDALRGAFAGCGGVRDARLGRDRETGDFKGTRRRNGPVAAASTDFTAKALLRDLPPGRRIHYRIAFEDRQGGLGPWSEGSLVTAARGKTQDVRFAWSGDTCGQGWGIGRKARSRRDHPA